MRFFRLSISYPGEVSYRAACKAGRERFDLSGDALLRDRTRQSASSCSGSPAVAEFNFEIEPPTGRFRHDWPMPPGLPEGGLD